MAFRDKLALFALAWVLLPGSPAWGGVYAQGARSWQNVEMLAEASAADMDLFMRAMNVSLGVECEHCHESGDNWHLEGREAKETARSMMRMLAGLSRSGFEALELPTCWTCHRGAISPPDGPDPVAVQAVVRPASAFSTSREPSGTVYENVRVLGDLPAADLADVMTASSASLGVDCAYCHVADNWSSDEKVTKLLARRMHEIQSAVNEEFFTTGPDVSCWTCHRGQRVPEINLPDALMPR